MKKLIFLLFILQSSIFAYGQSEVPMQIATTNIPSKDAKFLLFPTKNHYIFLKLNTRTGEVYMVQYSLDGDEFEVKINSYMYPLASKEEQVNGRFFLYPTTNIFTFILLDQIDGRVWQVQWDFKKENRMIRRIYSDSKYISRDDSINIKDLDYQDLIYYKDGERATGSVFIDDEYSVLQDFREGRPLYNDYFVFHKNGATAFIFGKDDLPNFSEKHLFWDDKGETISFDDFKEKYPEILMKVKKIMGISESKPTVQKKKPTPMKSSKK